MARKKGKGASKVPPPASKPKWRDPYIGRPFGTFLLEERIGQGGMGVVYRAKDSMTGDFAAVKILPEILGQKPRVAKRFRREATAAVRLQHPNIPKFYDAGMEDGLMYIAWELIDGESLEEMLEDKKSLDAYKVVEIMKQVLAALAHAHKKGVVHRDIKPPNVLTTSEGVTKLIDFGIAMDREASTALTLVGQVMGTPTYMSPEQALGKKVTLSADLYSCGVLMFRMLTGQRPFVGRSTLETMEMHVKHLPPSLKAIKSDIPAALEQLVHKLMEKKPRRRFKSAAATIMALEIALPPR